MWVYGVCQVECYEPYIQEKASYGYGSVATVGGLGGPHTHRMPIPPVGVSLECRDGIGRGTPTPLNSLTGVPTNSIYTQ